MRKIAICYPGDSHSILMVAAESMFNIRTPLGCEVEWFRGLGWCQARRRIHAAERGIIGGADLIVTLDVDQVYEPDILERLVARVDEGYDWVAAMVPLRGYSASSGMGPFQRLAWKLVKNAFVPVLPDDGDMQKCDYPTCAAMIFRASDLLKLPQPWYFYTYDPMRWEPIQAEDSTFAHRFKKYTGVQAWVDATIKVRHAHVFKVDETFQERFKDWAEPGVGDPDICTYGSNERS